MRTVLLLCILLTFVSYSTQQQLSFMLIGDWGGSTADNVTSTQTSVANAMGQAASTLNSAFVVSVGDNFYDSGVTSVNDFRWGVTYENVYTAPSLQTPWYIVAGNRDYYGNVSAEIEYTNISTRWKFPSLNHDMVYKIPNTDATVHIIYFDTWDLTSQSHDTGNLPDPVKGAAAQHFLESKLSQSNATWRFVVTHYPIYSGGAHGPQDDELQAALENILLKYQPDAYFCGHDHSEQHVVVNGMNYFVIGGGSEVTTNNAGSAGLGSQLKFMFPQTNKDGGGFGSVIATDKNATFQFWSTKPKIIYTVTMLPKDRTASPAPSMPSPTTTTAPTTSSSARNGVTFVRVLFLIVCTWLLFFGVRPNDY